MKRRSQRGHATLELALCAGVLLACLGGTYEFGYTFYVYNQLVTAVGNSARYAAVRPYRSEPEAAKAAIRNMVVFSTPKPAPAARPVIRDLKPENVEVDWTLDASGAPQSVHVSIQNYRVDALFGTFDFSGRPAVEFPFVGRYAPAEPEP
jgi:Flp pilus assembly protein TadG